MIKRAVIAFLLGSVLSACQHAVADRPAVLTDVSETKLARLKALLAPTVGRDVFEFGASDPAQSPVISVLPPRLTEFEMNSRAMPMLFDIVIRDGACLAIRRDAGDSVELTDIDCRPV
ncbi:MAG: hypothetical protein AAF582_05335 [Pseudomonadota bacterium]